MHSSPQKDSRQDSNEADLVCAVDLGGTNLRAANIDRDGRIREKIIGERTRVQFESSIKPLLEESQATAQNDK